MFFKQRLMGGDHLIGAGIFSGSPDMLEFVAGQMDWAWWECQHTHADWQTTLHGVRTGWGMNLPVLVRSWTHDGGTIERLLDTGAEGIIVPMVDTPQQAEAIVSHCHYPPAGNRSYGSIRTLSLEKDTDAWNQRIVTVMMLETPEAIENAEGIASVPGVDALLVGSADLAMRLGRSPQVHTSHSGCQDELKHVVEVCRRTGKAPAVIASNPEALAARVQEGYRLICAGFDLNHADAGYQQMRDALVKIMDQNKRCV